MKYLQPHPKPDSFDRALPRALGSTCSDAADFLDEAAARAEEDAARAQRRQDRRAEGERIARRYTNRSFGRA